MEFSIAIITASTLFGVGGLAFYKRFLATTPPIPDPIHQCCGKCDDEKEHPFPLLRSLGFDPFEGMGGKKLSDKIVTAAKDYPNCCWCEEPIVKGSKNRVMSETSSKRMIAHRWCEKCTAAMAVVDARHHDEDPSWEPNKEPADTPFISRGRFSRLNAG
jgi:hypothetical protein